MALKLNPVTGQLDVVLDKASEIKQTTSTSAIAGATVQDALNSVGPSATNYLKSLYSGLLTTGINQYANAAGSAPVNGTGGSPAGLTTALNTSTPLRGTSNQRLSKDAANRQGMGWSYDFTVDRADYEGSRGLVVSFTYDTSANYANGDMRVYAYDKDSGTLISVIGLQDGTPTLYAASNATKYSGIFYPVNNTSTNFRIILHIASTNATAYDLDVIDLAVSPDKVVPGAIVTDWVPYTPTFTGFGTPSNIYFKSRRVGDSLEVQGKFTSGTNTATTAAITIGYGGSNANVNVDTNKITSGEVIGIVASNTTPSTSYFSVYAISTTGNTINIGVQGSGSSGTSAVNASAGFSNSSVITLQFKVPIQGWSSSASLSVNDVALSQAKLIAYKNGGSVTAGTTIASWTGVTKDNVNGFNATTGVYTVQKAGDYLVSFSQTYTTSGVSRWASILVNGVTKARNNGDTADAGGGAITAMVTCNVGDQITVQSQVGAGTLSSTDFGTVLTITEQPNFNVFGVQGPIIVGAQTDWVDAGGLSIGAITTAPSKGTTATDKVWWRRIGDSMHVRMQYKQTAASAAGGSGDYIFRIPGGYQIDTTKVTAYATSEGWNGNYDRAFSVGTATFGDTNISSQGIGDAVVYDSTGVRIFGQGAGGIWGVIGSGGFATTNVAPFYSLDFVVPIVGWTSDTRIYAAQRVTGTVYLKDVKPAGTDGGTATSGAFQTRTLNTSEGDTGFCTLSSNQFTLQPGTYEIRGTAPANFCNVHIARIRNITDSTTAIVGTSGYSNTGGANEITTVSIVSGRITITSAKTFELQHRVETTRATNGFGDSTVNFGENALFSELKIDKIY